jgi:spore coat protein CotH
MGGDRPAGGGAQDGPDAGGAAQGGGPSQGNILSERFLNNDEFASLYESTLASLRETLYASGTASEILQQWVDALGTQDLVSSSTISQEAAAVAEYFD